MQNLQSLIRKLEYDENNLVLYLTINILKNHPKKWAEINISIAP